MTAADLLPRFDAPGTFVSVAPCGAGHINDTFKIAAAHRGQRVQYLLQRLNTRIFTRPLDLMGNMVRVTDHLRRKFAEQGREDVHRRVVRIIHATNGAPAIQDDAGHWWRLMHFVESTHTRDKAQSPGDAAEVGRAFGEFAALLADLPAPRLHETIPDFHNTPKRLAQFQQAVTTDPLNRAASVAAEIDFLQQRAGLCDRLLQLHRMGEIPERITHNDCKINNVLLDDAAGKGICVVDLDTVMPGLALYDFGDMVRTATASAEEDEPDLARVGVRLDMFKNLVRGYLGATTFLTPPERRELAFSGRLITLEQAIRFLADYLLGDVYYKIHRPAHNLDRARTQIKMMESMEAQQEAMEAIVLSPES